MDAAPLNSKSNVAIDFIGFLYQKTNQIVCVLEAMIDFKNTLLMAVLNPIWQSYDIDHITILFYSCYGEINI